MNTKLIINITETEIKTATGERIELTNAKEIVKVGLPIKTNGNGSGITLPFDGIVGEIYEEGFYVFSNTEKGTQGHISPATRGYRYASRIKFTSDGWIEVLGEVKPFNPKFILAVNGIVKEFETMEGTNAEIAKLAKGKIEDGLYLQSLVVYAIKDRQEVEFSTVK
jgi:hypothetical protein